MQDAKQQSAQNSQQQVSSKPIKTPCIGVCSTALGDSICRGCKRINHEVVQWNGYTNQEKQNIMDRLAGFMTQVVKLHITVSNPERLASCYQELKIKREPCVNAEAQAFYLLQALANNSLHTPELETLGLTPKPEWSNLSRDELFQLIDDAYYQLCLAYYDANYLRAYRQSIS